MSACGCVRNNALTEVSPEFPGRNGEELSYFSKTILGEENPLGIIGSVCPADGGIYIECKTINHKDGTSTGTLYFAEKSGDIQKMNSDWLCNSNIGFMCAAEGGGLWLIKTTYISKDTTEYELGSFKNGEYSTLLKLENRDNMYIHGLCCAKGRIFISQTNNQGINFIEAYTQIGKKEYEKSIGGQSFSIVSDGETLYIGKKSRNNKTLEVCSLEPESGNIKELASFGRGFILNCMPGKLYIWDSTGPLEYNIASGKSTRLFRWTACGLSGRKIMLWPDEKSGFIAAGAEGIKTLFLDTKRERKHVTLAVNAPPGMYSELIISFNEINAEYEVIIKDYSVYPDPQQMLNTDIISGNSPDLIDVAGFSGEIIKRGAMKDLMKYIKADKSIKKSDFLAGPLSAMMTEDGELLSIAPFFYVCTLLCREGTVETGNYNGVISALEKLGPPEDAFAGTFSRDSFLSLAFCCGGADKYSCDEVAAIIEYASKLPLEEDNSREIENLQNGKQRFMRITLGAPGHLFSTAIEDFACSGLDDLTVLGMPFYDGTGVVIPAVYFAIPANAANADGARAFLQNLLYIFDNKNTHHSYEDLNEYPLMQPIYN